MSDFSVNTEQATPGTYVVSTDGEITFANAEKLARELHAALDAGASHLVVDMTDVTFMDSSGLAALLRAATTARRTNGTLSVVHHPAGPPSILRFKGVDRLVRTFPSRDQALASAFGT